MSSIVATVISAIFSGLSFSTRSLGGKIEVISSGVDKYSSLFPGVDHFIVFSSGGTPTEISAILSADIQLSTLEVEFGEFHINYSFRDNVSEFKTLHPVAHNWSLVLVRDNKFAKLPDGSYAETSPQGNTISHKALSFDYFCLRAL